MDMGLFNAPYSKYNTRQLAQWKGLLDIDNAIAFGFAKNRMAMPGEIVKRDDVLQHMEHMEHEWEKEACIRTGSKAHSPKFTTMTIRAQEYLHSIMLSISDRTQELSKVERPAQREAAWQRRAQGDRENPYDEYYYW